MAHHPNYRRPISLHRQSQNPVSTKTRLATAQAVSTNARKTKVTLPKPEWEQSKEIEENEGVKLRSKE